jgi:transposase
VHGHKLLTGSDLGTASSGSIMRTIIFTADDRQALAHDRYHHPDPRVQRKMEVLWLKSHGLPHDQIAAYADVSRRSVQRYLDEYLEGGLPHLRRCRWHHPQSALAEHESSLEEYFRKHPPRSVKQARAIIEQQTGIRRGLTQVRHFLRDQLGLRWRQGLRISLGRLGAVGRNSPLLLCSPAGWESDASCTIDRQDNPTASGTSAP